MLLRLKLLSGASWHADVRTTRPAAKPFSELGLGFGPHAVVTEDSVESLCPCVQRLSLLAVERILDVDSPGHRPLRDADVVEHEADRMWADAKGSHSGGHGAAEIVHAEVLKPKGFSSPGKGARGRMCGDRAISRGRWKHVKG